MSQAIVFFTALISAAVLPAVHAAYTSAHNAFEPGPNFRTLQNAVKPGYNGYLDTWTDGTTFATNIRVTSGQAWPQIIEGLTSGIESQFTPGYPISVQNYLQLNGERYIEYSGSWGMRTHGDPPLVAPTGNRYNGAYIWLNNPSNYHSNGAPKWPYSVEINIWNKHDLGIPPNAHFYGNYYDSNGKYSVHGRAVNPDGNNFFAFYFLLDKSQETSSMLINVKAVLRFLRDNGQLHTGLDIVGIYVAAEGHGAGNGRPAADGKFTAVINNMGRP